MRRTDFSDLNAFVAVAEHLSFRAAAARLGVTSSAVSHAIRQLEDRLGVRLLNRTTRSVALTEAGDRMLGRLRPAFDQITDALEDLDTQRLQPLGRLRIYATHMAVPAVIAPLWQRFLATYPKVHLEVQVGEAPLDIVAEGFDAGIGPRDRAAGDMIAIQVMQPVKIAVVAAPAYFARHRAPRTPDDLLKHSCIEYRRAGRDGKILDWRFERGGKPQTLAARGQLTVNTPEFAVRAALDGLGMAYTIEALAEPFLRSGQLVRVLEDWSPAFAGLFLYYPGHRQVPATLRALIEMIRTAHGRSKDARAPLVMDSQLATLIS